MSVDALREIFPPDLKPLQRYRVINFIITLVLIAHMSWAFAGGYARADEVAQIKNDVNAILILSLEGRMRDLATELCGVAPASYRILQTEIDNLQSRHKDITGTYYTILVACKAPPSG